MHFRIGKANAARAETGRVRTSAIFYTALDLAGRAAEFRRKLLKPKHLAVLDAAAIRAGLEFLGNEMMVDIHPAADDTSPR